MGLKRKPPAGNSRRVRSTGQNICGVITNKAGRTVQFESFAERSFLLQLERKGDVRDYLSQPEQLHYVDNTGKAHRYTPDFQVWHTDGKTSLHEVTLTKRLDLPQIQQRHIAARFICAERDWKFQIHTEENLPQGSELANLLALWMYRSTRYDHPDISRAIQQALGHVEYRLYALVIHIHRQHSFSVAQIASCLYHQLWHGQIEMDWQTLLFQDAVPNPETQLCLSQKAGATWQK
jgi:hypothetical protein